MRDHLLGCAQFIPDVENEPTHFVTLRRRYPLGTPSRVHRDLESHVVRSMEDDQQITGFEEFDHTPVGMMADFPREYGLKTMLDEAAGRRDLPLHGNVLLDLMQEYDEQVQRQCGINDMVLNANKQTLKAGTYPTSAEIKDFYKRAALSKVEDWERSTFEARLRLPKTPVYVGVDLAVPGSDMSAVVMRRGPEMTYASSWDSLFPSK